MSWHRIRPELAQFTRDLLANAPYTGELREKLERLQALTHTDLAAVIEAAVTE